MKTESLLKPVSRINQIPIKREYRKFVEPDLHEIEKNEIFVIEQDVFELTKIVSNFGKVFDKIDKKETREIKKYRENKWKKSLKTANGDVRKARAIYDQL